MKYHDIPGVPFDVCTNEQLKAFELSKIALINRDIYLKAKTIGAFCASDVKHKIINQLMIICKRDNDPCINIDGVFSCLLQGLEAFLNCPFDTYDYTIINNIFPAVYK